VKLLCCSENPSNPMTDGEESVRFGGDGEESKGRGWNEAEQRTPSLPQLRNETRRALERRYLVFRNSESQQKISHPTTARVHANRTQSTSTSNSQNSPQRCWSELRCESDSYCAAVCLHPMRTVYYETMPVKECSGTSRSFGDTGGQE
jgi:hypothetical protein